MKIEYDTLIKVFQLLMRRLKESDLWQEANKKEIDIPYDFYWSVVLKTRQDVNKPAETDIGSIDHDIERLVKCLSEKDPDSHHFRYLGDILIAIADTLESRNIFI